MTLRGLYAITDGSIGNVLLDKVEQVLRGGAQVLQYRDKTNDPVRRQQEAQALRQLCQSYGAVLIINDDVVLAKAVQADGVHVGQEDWGWAAVRDYLGPQALIGVSCYNRLELALEAAQQGADYVAFGSFFPSPTKPHAVRASLELLQQARQQLTLPIGVIGGITLDTAPTLIEAGADMVAIITDVFSNAQIEQQVRRYQALFGPDAVSHSH